MKFAEKRIDLIEQTTEINNNMTKKNNHALIVSLGIYVLEIIGLSFLFFIEYYLRVQLEFNHTHSINQVFSLPRINSYILFCTVFFIIHLIYKYKTRKIFNLERKAWVEAFFCSSKEIVISLLVTIGIAFFLKITVLSRVVVLTFCLSGILYVFLLGIIKTYVVDFLYMKNILQNRVLIIGAGSVGEHIANEIENQKKYRASFIGYLDDKKVGRNILGKIYDIKEVISFYSINEVYITIPSQRETIHSLIQQVRKVNVRIKIIPELFNLVTSTVDVGYMNTLPYVTVIKTPMRGFNYFLKRLFDITVSFILIVLLSPIYLLTAISIIIDSRGKIVFKQHRIGKNGKTFSMYKFRSMVSNADELREKLLGINEMSGKAFKIRYDPRVTKVGRFIRKYSIDELPQLFNVLKGDMSLVGPRPPLPSEVKEYDDWEWRRLEVIPGITGLWQVSGRSDLSFDQWVKLDVYYIENWSIYFDIKLLLKTIPVLVKGKGAY